MATLPRNGILYLADMVTTRQRVLGYTDRTGWCLNAVAFICTVAAGTLLPLMDLIFGKFVTAFNDFTVGRLDPEGFRSEVDKYT